jgi:hypothetical protein
MNPAHNNHIAFGAAASAADDDFIARLLRERRRTKGSYKVVGI